MIEKIALITGGDSAEREVALNTASSIEKSLLEMGLSYELIMADKDMPSRLLEQDFSLAFLALHGGRGEDGSLQGFCEVLGIPYTGSGVFSSAICMNKTASKAFLKEAGLDTPKWQNLESPKDLALDFPLVIKPVYGGSSVATSVLRSSKGLEEAFEAAKREYGSSVMAEEYIPGREITVGVIDGEPLPALEIISPDGFFDYETKYSSVEPTHKPPEGLSNSILKRLEEDSVKAFEISECSGAARVDFRLDGNRLSILEINTIPGMTSTSLLPDAAALAGISFNDLVLKIIESGLKKNK